MEQTPHPAHGVLTRLARFCADAGMISKNDFVCVATVEIDGRLNRDSARAFATSKRMQGRALSHGNLNDNRQLWDFEVLDDAMLFNLMIGGQLRPAIDVAAWQRDEVQVLGSRPADSMINNAKSWLTR